MKSDWMSSFIGLVSESTRLPKWHSGKESAASARDTRDVGLIPGSGRSPGVGNGDLLQYSCLQSSTDRGDWRATVHGVTKSWTWLKWLSTHIRVHQETETTAGILVVKVRKKVKSLSRVWLFVDPWIVAYQAPLSMRFPRQGWVAILLEWVAIPFSRGSSQPRSPALQADASLSEL